MALAEASIFGSSPTTKANADAIAKMFMDMYVGSLYVTKKSSDGNAFIDDAIKNGNITEEANPNGSLLNIAGVCNKNRNVFGMMPHPERAADAELNNADGKILFDSILNIVLS